MSLLATPKLKSLAQANEYIPKPKLKLKPLRYVRWPKQEARASMDVL